jgi:phosphoribosylformimino-5-aminoimidazole carboxamide ribotide isomerase
LHLVDLDGARDGVGVNAQVVAAIVRDVGLPCQLGGGVRDEATIAAWLERGIQQLVIGTRAVQDPDWLRGLSRRYPDRLVLGLDAKDGYVASHGWLQVSHLLATELASQFAGERLAGIVYTDIARDGMLQGPNVEAVRRMRDAVDLPVIASGGVTTVDDVRRLARLEIAGCIIGRAFYEGTLSLTAAQQAAEATGAADEATSDARPAGG